jgi:opacity protein-like surface antigen
MNKPLTYASSLAAVAMLGVSLNASAAEGVYVGGSVLQSYFDSDSFSEDDIEDFDDDDTGWKILVGFRLNPHFGIEGAYTDFGEANAPSVPAGGPFEANAKAFSAFGVGFLPVGPVDLFLKAGAARIDAEGNVGAVFFDDKSTEFAYGAGVQLNIGRLGLRAEYEKFDTDEIGDLDIASLGFVFTFGP